MTTTHEALRALAEICAAIDMTIQETGSHGAPAGVLYAALSAQGCSLDMFSRIMGAMVATGRVRYSNHVYYSVAAADRPKH